MTLTEQILTIAMVVLGTMLTRFLPFLIFPAGRETPRYIQYLGRVLPGAVFTPANCCRTTPLKENQSESICDILPNYWDRISAQHNCTGCRLRKI